jgi:hypothetical protein
LTVPKCVVLCWSPWKRISVVAVTVFRLAVAIAMTSVERRPLRSNGSSQYYVEFISIRLLSIVWYIVGDYSILLDTFLLNLIWTTFTKTCRAIPSFRHIFFVIKPSLYMVISGLLHVFHKPFLTFC